MMRDRSLAGLVLAVIASMLVATLLKSPVYAGLVAYAAVLGLFALSVNLVFGTLGYVTFGHAAFLGLGAYTAGIVTQAFGLNFWWTVPLAVVPGVLLGAVLGLASIRLGGAYFAIASLTVAEILRLVAANWVDLTRGPMGLVVMPSALPGSWHGIGPQAGFLGAVLIAVALTVFILRRLQGSPVGRAWTAIRQSLPLAESLGIPTLRYRVANLALSGGIAGLAGALLVPKILVLTPDLLGPVYSATGLLAVILGGRGTLIGPLLGGAIFAVLPEWLRFLGDLRLAVFALLLLLIVRLLPGGLASLLPRPRSRRTLTATPAAQEERRLEAVFPPATETFERGELLLDVRGVAKSFRGLRALGGVDLKVHASEVVGLIGPNGAGKTTCLNVLSGYFAPDSGQIRLLGQDVAGIASHRMARLGLVRTFQQTTLFGDLSVADNVLVATHLAASEHALAAVVRTRSFLKREAHRAAHARAAIERVGLGHRADALASSLSYGEQRMLAIASALAAGPRVLLLDEPAAGLNHTEATALANLIRSLRREGMGIIIIDHNLKMIMSLCDQVVVLHHGEKIAAGTPDEVRSDPVVVRAYMGGVAEDKHA
ncbi:MAG: branched-chain amino acid ABC transporter ATP-binding protein/permease [Ottowia sp.]|uniref:branched-chain amino acid ABC transporter ATP-binding protein/permease n=1 Tax=unclassified Ottowia TaxID=2645081 RepID=UPI003C2ABEC5